MSTTIEIAHVKALLAACVRNELSDFAFGDSEVDWFKDGKLVASGYFGSSHCDVYANDGSWSFTGDLARSLRDLGRRGKTERNDSGGN